MELRYIRNLFIAGKVYFESKNIASFDLEKFIKFVRFVAVRVFVSSSGSKGLADVLKCSSRDVSGYLSLCWHLGILSIESFDRRGRYRYRATKLAKKIAEVCSDVGSERCLEFLRSVFLSWEPLRVLLRFARDRAKLDPREVVRVLGEEMRFWNEKLLALGLPVSRSPSGRVPAKPFNDFVVRKLFLPLVKQLNLLDRDVVERIYTVAKSRGGEPIVAAGIAHVVYSSRESVLISPFLDEYGASFVIRAAKLSNESKHVTLVVRKARVDIDMLRKSARDSGIELDVRIAERPLHAKIYASKHEVFLSSANLLRTSLLRNVEFGIMLHEYPHEVESIVEQLV